MGVLNFIKHRAEDVGHGIVDTGKDAYHFGGGVVNTVESTGRVLKAGGEAAIGKSDAAKKDMAKAKGDIYSAGDNFKKGQGTAVNLALAAGTVGVTVATGGLAGPEALALDAEVLGSEAVAEGAGEMTAEGVGEMTAEDTAIEPHNTTETNNSFHHLEEEPVEEPKPKSTLRKVGEQFAKDETIDVALNSAGEALKRNTQQQQGKQESGSKSQSTNSDIKPKSAQSSYHWYFIAACIAVICCLLLLLIIAFIS